MVPIERSQVNVVFREVSLGKANIGRSSPSFKRMREPGNRVFVLAVPGHDQNAPEAAIVGEIPIDEIYEDTTHPHGQFRIRSNKGGIRYPHDVALKDIWGDLTSGWAQCEFDHRVANQFPTRLTPHDAELISRRGAGKD